MHWTTAIALATTLAFGITAEATDLDIVIDSEGCATSSITVGPGCVTTYRVKGVLSDTDHQGLASVFFDLDFTIENTGGGLLEGTVSEACADFEITSGGCVQSRQRRAAGGHGSLRAISRRSSQLYRGDERSVYERFLHGCGSGAYGL